MLIRHLKKKLSGNEKKTKHSLRAALKRRAKEHAVHTVKEKLKKHAKHSLKHHAKKAVLRALLVLGLSVCLSSVSFASPTLSSGSHGHDVFILQKKLSSIGYTIKTIDGVFGQETESAVATFQRDQKIRVTGIVNNATWRALQKAKDRPWGTDIKPPASAKPVKPTNYVPNGTQILSSSEASTLIATAKKYIGTPYQFGGATPKAFDCSGFLQYIFRERGINIPRTADEQYKLGLRTKSQKELVPGDLVFFTTYEPGPSHCGIYLGSGDFIHASSSKGVRIDNLSNTYWAPRYIGGKHIIM